MVGHWTQCAAGWICLCLAATGTLRAQEEAAEPVPAGARTVPVDNATVKVIHVTSLSARAAGVLLRMDVSEGTVVRQGDQIGLIDDGAVRLQLARAEAAEELAIQRSGQDIDERLAGKRAEVATNELERAVAANQRTPDAYPLKEIDRLRLVADSAQLEIERAAWSRKLLEQEARTAGIEVAQVRELLSRHAIAAPCDGVVTAVEKHPGEWVEPGTVVVQIVSTGRLRIEGFVAGDLAPRIRAGQPARIGPRAGQGDWQLEGAVTFVSPDSNPVNGQVRVFIEFDNRDERVRPGMRVDAGIGASED